MKPTYFARLEQNPSGSWSARIRGVDTLGRMFEQLWFESFSREISRQLANGLYSQAELLWEDKI